jgi:hypothetical protein
LTIESEAMQDDAMRGEELRGFSRGNGRRFDRCDPSRSPLTAPRAL